MKKLTTMMFAAVIAVALSMPALAQTAGTGSSTAPAKKTTTDSKDKKTAKKATPKKKTSTKKTNDSKTTSSTDKK
ncbi:MAG TPA: hypothetical protein VGK48_05510 [Terriglobia bacterium]|jgi:ABC-type transporter MlaC component